MPAMKHLVVRSTPTPSTLAAGRRYKAGREFVHVMPEHVSSLEPVHRHLFGVSPEADPTDVSIKVLSGTCTLAGDGDGEIGAGKSLVLDPERLTAASGEWTLTRPAGTPSARYELVVGEDPTFTLQRLVPAREPGGDPAWTDVDATLNLQATARLRPKPPE